MNNYSFLFFSSLFYIIGIENFAHKFLPHNGYVDGGEFVVLEPAESKHQGSVRRVIMRMMRMRIEENGDDDGDEDDGDGDGDANDYDDDYED